VQPRTTAIAFLVAAALGCFVYFYVIRGDEARREAEAVSRRLFPGVEAGAIESIALTTTDDTAVRIERRDNRWELVQPFDFPADAFAADGMASSLAQLESEAVFENPQPLEEYGLDANEREVRFRAGADEHVLRVGDKTPIGANSYVWTSGADHVYAVPTFGLNSLSKSFDELRDKRILSFDRDAIVRIDASWPDGHVLLDRGEEGWRLLEPVEGPADAATVERLLSDLSLLRADGFLDESVTDEQVGLDRPAFAVELRGAAGEEGEEPARFFLAIGSKLDGASHLARGALPSLYRVPARRIADLPRDVVDYRFKQLADFAATAAKRVELLFRDDAGDSLKVVAERGETGWVTDPPEFDPDKAAALVDQLSNLRGAGILADAATPDELAELRLAPANVELTVFGDEGAATLAEVQIGAVRGDEGIVARRRGDEMVFLLDHALAEQIPVSVEAYRNRFVVEATQAEDEAEAEPGAVLNK
jgi:hypothetical protein